MEFYLYLFFRLYPIMLTLLLVYVIIQKYKEYIRYRFWFGQKKVLLKISIPREIEKTPVAMENFFDSIYDTGRESNIKARWLKGSQRPEFSFEIVSIEGSVYFFIWTEAFFKDLLKRNLHANYPGVEIEEVFDYAKNINYDPDNAEMFAFEYKLTKADPYPIKTYRAYELDKGSLNDKTKTDPLASIIEALAGIGSGQQMWIQITIRGHAKDKKKKKTFLEFIKTRERYEKFNWAKEAQDLIKDLGLEKELKKKYSEEKYSDSATKREKEVVNAIVENIAKTPYEVGIRSIYIASKNNFKGSNIPILAKLFRPYSSEDLNSINPNFTTGFDYDWQDPKKTRIKNVKKKIFYDYRRRKWNYTGWGNRVLFMKARRYVKFILSSEELASIFHIPTTVIENTKIDKASSKKVDPPMNLPF